MGGQPGPRPSGVMDCLAILTQQLHDPPPLSTPTPGGTGWPSGGAGCIHPRPSPVVTRPSASWVRSQVISIKPWRYCELSRVQRPGRPRAGWGGGLGRECLGLAPSAQLKTDLRGHPSLSAPGDSPRPPPMSPATPSLSSCKWRSQAHSLSQSPPALGEPHLPHECWSLFLHFPVQNAVSTVQPCMEIVSSLVTANLLCHMVILAELK